MNLAALQQQMQMLGYGTDTAAQQTLMLNDAYRLIHSQQRWPFLEKQATLSTVAGVNVVPYTSIADLVEFDSVRLAVPGDTSATQSINLQNVESQDMRDMEQLDATQGIPTFWSLIANAIHLYSFPDKVYTLNVDYIYAPPDLVVGTDVPVLPTEYHDLLVWGAIKLMNFRERDIYSYNTSSMEFEQRLKRMKQALLLRQRQTPSTVKKSGFYGSGTPLPWNVF